MKQRREKGGEREERLAREQRSAAGRMRCRSPWAGSTPGRPIAGEDDSGRKAWMDKAGRGEQRWLEGQGVAVWAGSVRADDIHGQVSRSGIVVLVKRGQTGAERPARV
ncbi:hypothetical protein RJT34_19737 [Clitoria ternatea]|uniref:Uncharacterized protein n=1 Tax=Clitoria ternatea TaxID=43366 RepID=A0AAN9IRK2_CLITE